MSIPINEIEQEYNALLLDEKEIHKELDLETQKQRALQRLAYIYKKQLRSPAVGFEGIIIGVSDCVDIIAKQKREAIALYRNDPQTAIAEGITDEEGIPLDTKREWANGRQNPNYGKPLPENNFLRNIFGVATKIKSLDNKPKFFSMTINGEKANNENIPMFTPIKFMAIDKSQTSEVYSLNSSQFTNFMICDDLILPPIKTIIKDYCGNVIVDLKNLNQYHDVTKNNFNRIVIVEGDVSNLSLEQTSMNNKVMTIEDINSIDLDSKGVTCWIPPRYDIDFAEGSKVIVVGRTNQGKKKDEHGDVTEELGDITLNVMGIYVLPEYKISQPKEIKTLIEDDFEL